MSYERIFDESFDRVSDHVCGERGFFEAFYERFLAASPKVRDKFRDTDMARQQRMLRKSFFSLVAFYASGSVDNILERIARNHGAHGLDIEPALYDLWLECLIDTVREFDPAFEDDVELAWRLVLSSGITYMKFKYEH